MNGELVVRDGQRDWSDRRGKTCFSSKKSHDSHQTHAQEKQSTKWVRRKITPTHRIHGPHIERCNGKQSEAKADECTTTWMIGHAAFLQHESPLEPTETLFAHVNISRITRVNFFRCGPQRRDDDIEVGKFDSRFVPDCWLGRATETDEIIEATPRGIYTARSIRAKSHQEMWNARLIK